MTKRGRERLRGEGYEGRVAGRAQTVAQQPVTTGSILASARGRTRDSEVPRRTPSTQFGSDDFDIPYVTHSSYPKELESLRCK